MTSVPPAIAPNSALHFMPPESWPNYDHIVTEDGKPVDGFYDEKQMRLLTSVLRESWPGPGAGRPFLATANVGLFYSFNEPPVVPDVMLSLDVRVGITAKKKHRSYFVWEYGKPPDATIEIVSGTDGEELGNKLSIYERIGVPYYVVWDPDLQLSDKALHCFIRKGRKYEENGSWFSQIGLGVAAWDGIFEDWDKTWLRWCDEHGNVWPTGAEKIAQEQQRAEQETQRAEQEKQRAESEKQRAEQEKQRAESEKQRAEKLAERLRAMGADPDQP